MVGEIRDLETAEIAIKAAQTGHLVLSTLHTNDAPTTLTRLVDMGVKPYAIATSVILIIAQRLARRLCSNCKEPVDVPPRRCSRKASPRAVEPGIKVYKRRRLRPVHGRLQGPRRHLPGHAVTEGDPAASSWKAATRCRSRRRPREGVWDLRRRASRKSRTA